MLLVAQLRLNLGECDVCFAELSYIPMCMGDCNHGFLDLNYDPIWVLVTIVFWSLATTPLGACKDCCLGLTTPLGACNDCFLGLRYHPIKELVTIVFWARMRPLSEFVTFAFWGSATTASGILTEWGLISRAYDPSWTLQRLHSGSHLRPNLGECSKCVLELISDPSAII